MVGFFRRFLFTIVLAQWLYAEALIIFPASRPVLETLAQYLRPPTHDKLIETYRSFEQRTQLVASLSESANRATESSSILSSFGQLEQQFAAQMTE